MLFRKHVRLSCVINAYLLITKRSAPGWKYPNNEQRLAVTWDWEGVTREIGKWAEFKVPLHTS